MAFSAHALQVVHVRVSRGFHGNGAKNKPREMERFSVEISRAFKFVAPRGGPSLPSGYKSERERGAGELESF